MIRTTVWRPGAMEAYRNLRTADLAAANTVAELVRRLASEPCPAEAAQLGGSKFYRLHVQDLRILYEIDEVAGAVFVHSIGRVPRLG